MSRFKITVAIFYNQQQPLYGARLNEYASYKGRRWLKNWPMECAPKRKAIMKAFIITPHEDPDYDCCIIEKELDAKAELDKIVEQLWDNLEYGQKFKIEVEFRELTNEEARSI